MGDQEEDGDVSDVEHSRLCALSLWKGTMAWNHGTHQCNGDASYGGEDKWYRRRTLVGTPSNTNTEAYHFEEYTCA